MNDENPPAAVRDTTFFTFHRIHREGVVCICTPDESEELVQFLPAGTYERTAIRMTQRSFNALPDFQGWP